MRRVPLIGITADRSSAANGSNPGPEPVLFLPQRYCHAIQEAGGIPLILPPVASQSGLRSILQRVDGVLISGGNFDIHPSYYSEKPISTLGSIKRDRTEFELELVKLACHRDLPLLGICGGAQAINVALGGSLYQDIVTQLPHAVRHEQGTKRNTGGHRIIIHLGTQLRQIVRKQALEVNTTHHQAVRNLGKGLIVNATAQDGLIEGLESSRHSFVLGVQWHPESLARKDQHRIFLSFISASERFRRGI